MSEKDPENGKSSKSGRLETELSRDMSLFDITFIGVGAMIGAGVFALTGFAAEIAGPALILAFALNGFVALFTAVSYAELGAAFPEAGGGYLWVKEALVDPNGFFAGWMSWFAHAVACSLYAITFGVFLTEFIVIFTGLGHSFVFYGFLDRLLIEKILAVLMVALFTYINFMGAEETGKAGVIVTGIKVLILGIFVIFGILATFRDPNWVGKFFSSPSFAPKGIFGILGAMGFTYIAFEGYEIIVQSGEEVKNPGLNIPKAVFYSLLIVVPIYILVAFAAIGGIDITQQIVGLADTGQQGSNLATWQILGDLGELGIIRAAEQFVPYGAPLLLIAGLTATMSALNATVYSSSRVSFAMGRDRALPKLFERIHQEKRTPHWAIFLSGVLIVLMAIILPIESVAASADIMFILLFIQVNWTVIKMRQTHPDLPRTYKIPYMPWPPIIGIILQFLLTPFLIYELGLQYIGIGTGNEGLVALVTTSIWMVLGLILYYGYSTHKEKEKLEEEAPTVVTEKATKERENQIIVPIANPETVDQLMHTAIDIAKEKNGEILVLSVVTVPQQTPLSEGRKFVEEKRPTINRAIELGEESDVPVNGSIRISHDVSKAILNTIEQYESDTVLMGWRGRSRRKDFVFGSNVDKVISKAKCDVLVEKIGKSLEEIDNILVPTAGGPHADLSIEVAKAIAYTNDSDIDIVHVVSPDSTKQNCEKAQKILDDAKKQIEDFPNVSTKILEGDDIVDTIVDQTKNYDITIIGATREGLFQQFLFGSLPERVGEKAKNTVIMTKKYVGIKSFITRWFKTRKNN